MMPRVLPAGVRHIRRTKVTPKAVAGAALAALLFFHIRKK